MSPHRIDDDIELRLLEERHAQELFGAIDRNRADLRIWLPWIDGSRSADDITVFIRSSRRELAGGTGVTSGIWHHGRMVGCVGLRIDPANRSGEIGYWLVPEARGQGIMAKAARALVDHGFGEVKLHRIVMQCATGNRASRAIPERLGFTLEGTLREAEWVNDHFNDLVLYALLRREWDARRAGQSSGALDRLGSGEQA
jgi:ribosomal-protein-serine acetyltransferase